MSEPKKATIMELSEEEIANIRGGVMPADCGTNPSRTAGEVRHGILSDENEDQGGKS